MTKPKKVTDKRPGCEQKFADSRLKSGYGIIHYVGQTIYLNDLNLRVSSPLLPLEFEISFVMPALPEPICSVCHLDKTVLS